MHEQLVQQIDDLLPQTQCTQCGFEGCLPYAKALASDKTDINRCPPGGQETVRALSVLLNKQIKPIDSDCGTTIVRHIAHIQAEHCIGCTLCIKACPVDAIAGSTKKRHVVIAPLCTGCQLCISPCPVDCIDMQLLPQFSTWDRDQAHQARARMNTRSVRLERQRNEQNDRLESKAIHKMHALENSNAADTCTDQKKTIVQAAIDRARARRKNQTTEQPPSD